MKIIHSSQKKEEHNNKSQASSDYQIAHVGVKFAKCHYQHAKDTKNSKSMDSKAIKKLHITVINGHY